MATIPWPSTKLFEPQAFTWGERRRRRASGEPAFGGDEQVGEVPFSHRWTAEMVLVPCASFAERAQQEGVIARIVRGDNRVELPHLLHRRPYGTLTGAVTLSGALTQGATTAVLSGGAVGQTLEVGDMIGVTTLAARPVQLVRVVVGGVQSGGTMPITFEPPLRAAANAGALVVLNSPTALFRCNESTWQHTATARNAQPIALSFVEVLS